MPSLTSIPQQDHEIARFTVTVGSVSGTTRIWYNVSGPTGSIDGDYVFGGGMTVSRLRYHTGNGELRYNKTGGPSFTDWATAGVLSSLGYTDDVSSVPDGAPLKNLCLYVEFVDGTVDTIDFEGNTHSGSGFFTVRLVDAAMRTRAQARAVGDVIAFVIAGLPPRKGGGGYAGFLLATEYERRR